MSVMCSFQRLIIDEKVQNGVSNHILGSVIISHFGVSNHPLGSVIIGPSGVSNRLLGSVIISHFGVSKNPLGSVIKSVRSVIGVGEKNMAQSARKCARAILAKI